MRGSLSLPLSLSVALSICLTHSASLTLSEGRAPAGEEALVASYQERHHGVLPRPRRLISPRRRVRVFNQYKPYKMYCITRCTPPGACRLLCTPPGACQLLCTPLGACQLLCTPPGACRLLCTPPGACRLLCTPPGAWWLLYTPPGICRLLLPAPLARCVPKHTWWPRGQNGAVHSHTLVAT